MPKPPKNIPETLDPDFDDDTSGCDPIDPHHIVIHDYSRCSDCNGVNGVIAFIPLDLAIQLQDKGYILADGESYDDTDLDNRPLIYSH